MDLTIRRGGERGKSYYIKYHRAIIVKFVELLKIKTFVKYLWKFNLFVIL